jgi:4-amino-4-deoxy-L-arabinose transferase-like glycosyltransferase
VAIHFSRLALNIPEVLLLATSCFYCLWRGYCSQAPLWWLLSGLAAGKALLFPFHWPVGAGGLRAIHALRACSSARQQE